MPTLLTSDKLFQSTLPHGSDPFFHFTGNMLFNFNPRSLTGATPFFHFIGNMLLNFNPRSLTGATSDLFSTFDRRVISIHAPSRERRATSLSSHSTYSSFQSTLPHGSDYTDDVEAYELHEISIHAPSRERPLCPLFWRLLFFISIHAPSRERHSFSHNCSSEKKFQSTLPHGSDSYL